MADEKFAEFKRIWGVDGMPLDKIKLATAAFTDGRAAGIAWAEKFTAEQIVEMVERVAALYPVEVFPDDGRSIDAQSAKMGRIVCENIIGVIKEKFALGL